VSTKSTKMSRFSVRSNARPPSCGAAMFQQHLREFRSALRAWLLAACCAICSACAFDGHGAGSVRWFAADGAYIAHVRGWGAHLFTTPGDHAWVLGTSRRIYVFGDPLAVTQLESVLLQLGTRPQLERARPLDPALLPRLGEPLAVFALDRGLSLRLNTRTGGVTLGQRASSHVQIPRDAQVVFVVEYDSDFPDSTQALFRNYRK
jgi:hypothetical protein